MPKKFGTNTKAAEARERKENVKQEKLAKDRKAKEDAEWEETDKKVLAKQQRQKEEEQKRQEALKKRQEARALADAEAAELAKKYTKPADHKVTRALIEERKREEQARAQAEKKKGEETMHHEQPLEPNVNRVIAEEKARMEEEGVDYVEARDVSEAITGLSMEEKEDKHPEKRLKQLHLAYEEKWIPILREENPSLKLSQLKEMVWKQWQKAPENPLNQQ